VRMSLPLRQIFSRMLRSKRPAQTRTKAMRSRCARFILACTLKTTPAIFSSVGVTGHCKASRGPVQIEDPAEALAHAHRPSEGRHRHRQHALDLIHDIERSRTSRSSLLMKVISGVRWARQTSSRRRVCDSTPLAASTAVGTR